MNWLILQANHRHGVLDGPRLLRVLFAHGAGRRLSPDDWIHQRFHRWPDR